MIIEFENAELETLYVTPLNALKGKQKFPAEVIKQYKKKLSVLIGIKALEDLRPFKGLNFEYLKGDRKGQCSIRLNDQYRLIFVPTQDGNFQILLIKEISKYYE
ncbi:MAG: type II toxin-antitoxin system RelE/ParE family toxin [Bacteroidia bacterium]|nr:type II toxin-antitoxin system RelE/ParE family toxin [Bacteroidia bacterium]